MRRTTLVIALLVSACQTSPNTPLRPEAVGDGPVTFNKQVVRVFQRNCQTCHRPGEVAPFSLTNDKDAHARRDDIREAVESRYMPPWKAVPGHGEFADVRRLSEDEICLVARWVADGAPEGRAARSAVATPVPDGVDARHAVGRARAGGAVHGAAAHERHLPLLRRAHPDSR